MKDDCIICSHSYEFHDLDTTLCFHLEANASKYCECKGYKE